MNLIGTMELSPNIKTKLEDIRENRAAALNTLEWLGKQSFNQQYLRNSIEDEINKIDQERANLIAGLREELKQKFPQGKKMALMSDYSEVKIYG